jgi:hypothetical protein
MEPMIIYVSAHEGDLIKIIAAEFEKYIKQAYEAGVADGVKAITTAPTQPIYRGEPKIEPLPYVGDTPGWWQDRIVWCNASAVNNDISCIYTAKGE